MRLGDFKLVFIEFSANLSQHDFSERSFGTLATDMEQLNLLIPQLSGSAQPMTQTEFAEIINSSTTHLYVAEENHTILGMLSLAIFPIPTGVRAWVEDVVVKTEARGKGVGKCSFTRHF